MYTYTLCVCVRPITMIIYPIIIFSMLLVIISYYIMVLCLHHLSYYHLHEIPSMVGSVPSTEGQFPPGQRWPCD